MILIWGKIEMMVSFLAWGFGRISTSGSEIVTSGRQAKCSSENEQFGLVFLRVKG